MNDGMLYDISFFFKVIKHPIQICHKSHKIFLTFIVSPPGWLEMDESWSFHCLSLSSLERLLCEYSGSPYSMRKKLRTRGKWEAVQWIMTSIVAGTQIFLVALGCFVLFSLYLSLTLQGTHSRVLCDVLQHRTHNVPQCSSFCLILLSSL